MTKKHFLAELEENMLDVWDKERTFKASLENRKGKPEFTFYDGPPFANGIPHYGHFEQTTIKDTITRFKTMRGYYVERRVGWDTHGLPIEYAIEKQHEFKSKKDIVDYGIDKFNKECRDSVFIYKDVWEKMFRRAGRWADYERTYATLDSNYIESVWWVFKTIYDKGLVYKDFRSSPYCPRCSTPLSNFELNQGYQDNVKDPSLYVKFKLLDEDAHLLGWTTTPWSLPGNAAIAVNPHAQYVYVELKDDNGKTETLVLAKDRLSVLDVETYKIIREVSGKDLQGKSYEPLFELSLVKEFTQENLYKVWLADFVSTEDGSGVLHVAPAFGEDDLSLAKQHNIPVLVTVDEIGHVIKDSGLPEVIKNKFFKSADDAIISHLTKLDRVFAAGHLLHTYPFCWRCDTPLLYYATDSWMVKVTAIKERLIANNQIVNWVPKTIKNGRFGNWLEQARDWAISRNRFWGTPLPIWVTDDGEVVVIGSIEELKRLAVNPEQVSDLHRPYIDDVVIKTSAGKEARRVPEVFDVWFESGSMPYGQNHYPFENKENKFPADFIAEAIDQTRGWFYTLHVLATALFDQPAFENVISSGWIVAADGEKLSKRKKNYAPMDEVFDQYGVDTLRFFIASSPLMNGEDTRFSVDFLRDVQRKVFMTLLNTFNFYKTYSEVDKWKPDKEFSVPKSDNVLDQWIIARTEQAIKEVTESLDKYRLDKGVRPIVDYLDDLSNWFVRRSRRRFWKGQDDDDKHQAYETLYYALIRTCQMLAPVSPFMSDHIWRQLANGNNLPSSVHLSDWPKAGQVDYELLDAMQFARTAIAMGLKQRADAGIKVRQPLNSVRIVDNNSTLKDEMYSQLIAEELNVKNVEFIKIEKNRNENLVQIDTNVTDKLQKEGLAREAIRFVQNARKEADLKVDDRIELTLETNEPYLREAINEFSETIKNETLAIKLNDVKISEGFTKEVNVDGNSLKILLRTVNK